jgi:predicted lipoprotein with Yx(FWY)xxD motif
MKTQPFANFMRVLLVTASLVAGLQACDKEDAAPADPTPAPNNPAPGTANVKLAANPTLGNVLTDKDGKTLYFFTRDADGTSACTGGCLAAWPLFYEKELVPGQGLNAADFGVITRADGAKQTTYKGLPLYRFANDAAAGDVKGEGSGTTWFVAKPDYTVFLADKDGAKFLVDGNAKGKTLYLFAVDADNVSNCTGGCLANWPAFSAEKVVAPSLLKAEDFATLTRPDQKKQITYKKRPLYFFAGDQVRGDVKGKSIANWTPAAN